MHQAVLYLGQGWLRPLIRAVTGGSADGLYLSKPWSVPQLLYILCVPVNLRHLENSFEREISLGNAVKYTTRTWSVWIHCIRHKGTLNFKSNLHLIPLLICTEEWSGLRHHSRWPRAWLLEIWPVPTQLHMQSHNCWSWSIISQHCGYVGTEEIETGKTMRRARLLSLLHW